MQTFVMLERWQDQASLDAALAKSFSEGDDPKELLKLVDGPPARERYEVRFCGGRPEARDGSVFGLQ